MPNVTVPAAATGLPEETAVLAETDRGLAVVRPAGLKALRPTFLDGDALDAFLKTLDDYATVTSVHDLAHKDALRLRRAMISPLKKIRAAKSRTLDDILFKALVVESADRFACERSNTLGHSIVNDLLSADCMWRAA